jgi:hypothetical protein
VVRGDARQRVQGRVGSIPRSRNRRNQRQIFSGTKQIIEKSLTNQSTIIIRKIEATQEIIQIYKPSLSNQILN